MYEEKFYQQHAAQRQLLRFHLSMMFVIVIHSDIVYSGLNKAVVPLKFDIKIMKRNQMSWIWENISL